MKHSSKTILLTGATGYVGGRLCPRLLRAGYRVRVLTRSIAKLKSRPWSDNKRLEIVQSNLEDVESLTAAMEGIDEAYYLVHSMQTAGSAFAQHDEMLANNFAKAASAASISRIIYLGGLGEMGDGLSEHLYSRQNVGNCLASTNIPVTTLRAAMIIGSGSASFEILRFLVERLPLMITPKWVNVKCQPISILDTLHYLEAVLSEPKTIGKTIDIGGSEILDYEELIHTIAELMKIPKRLIIRVPLLTPRLSSYWIHLVTPLSSKIARPLAEGLRNEVICREQTAATLLEHTPLSARESIKRALHDSLNDVIPTAWSDAGRISGDHDWAGGKVFTDSRTTFVDAKIEDLYKVIKCIGGKKGYYAANWLWEVRGYIDKLFGGPGLQRGRRSTTNLEIGDSIDFWRVINLRENKSLKLRAEMKLPGVATLLFEMESDPTDLSRVSLKQIATFKPRGLFGILYWYLVKPLHGIVFDGMLNGIAAEASRLSNLKDSSNA
mgnify:FL=1|jgi:uncharacterized protein YbjT (DUF2867 family)|tara:strand:+ start:399 stop:1883 length:1485 start_codon:yes stop_codon:yes gene_type:complete